MKKREDEKRRIVTVTSKRMITIPAKKYGIKKSTKLEVIDTGKGLLLVPIVPFEDLFNVDDKETAKKIIEGIHRDRKKILN
ncbi:MAG: AbrB/MazE/SpoVT family DNA-binding domain-containing protein [Candidatus Asgardarchaeia archaeon]